MSRALAKVYALNPASNNSIILKCPYCNSRGVYNYDKNNVHKKCVNCDGWFIFSEKSFDNVKSSYNIRSQKKSFEGKELTQELSKDTLFVKFLIGKINQFRKEYVLTITSRKELLRIQANLRKFFPSFTISLDSFRSLRGECLVELVIERRYPKDAE